MKFVDSKTMKECGERVSGLVDYLVNNKIKYEVVVGKNDYKGQYEKEEKANAYIVIPMWRIENDSKRTI